MNAEAALAKPCKSFSFDDNFALDSDASNDVAVIDENWSPVAMGAAKVTLDSRVSPLKQRNESHLLGGLHPVQSNNMPRTQLFESPIVTAEEAAFAATSEKVQVSLRVQFMHNAEDYLLSYKE